MRTAMVRPSLPPASAFPSSFLHGLFPHSLVPKVTARSARTDGMNSEGQRSCVIPNFWVCRAEPATPRNHVSAHSVSGIAQSASLRILSRLPSRFDGHGALVGGSPIAGFKDFSFSLRRRPASELGKRTSVRAGKEARASALCSVTWVSYKSRLSKCGSPRM